jgi:hypothetical protein
VSIAIAVGALIAALAPLGAMWVTLKQHVDEGYESSLEKRVERLERDLGICEERRTELEAENLRLMRKLLTDEP